MVRFSTEPYPRSAFYLRRAFRILPLWWAYVFLAAAIRGAPASEIVPHLTFLFGFEPHESFTRIGWTLFVEEAFYLFFPLLFIGLRKPWGAIVFLVGMILFSDRVPNWTPSESLPAFFHPLYFLPIRHFVTFGLGILVFHFRGTRVNPQILDVLAYMVIAFSFGRPSHGNFAILALALFTFAAVTPGTWIRRAMENKILRAFGVVSFSAYLFHALILLGFRQTDFFRALGEPYFYSEAQTAMAFVLLAVATFAISRITYATVELPCVHLGRRVISAAGARFQRRFREALPARDPLQPEVER